MPCVQPGTHAASSLPTPTEAVICNSVLFCIFCATFHVLYINNFTYCTCPWLLIEALYQPIILHEGSITLDVSLSDLYNA